jgi:hypothetical protein
MTTRKIEIFTWSIKTIETIIYYASAAEFAS